MAMIVLGLGSLPLCWSLLLHRLVGSLFAVWGLVGYAVFALGFLLEFFGFPYSMYLLIPGGLWEITFGICLLVGKLKLEV